MQEVYARPKVQPRLGVPKAFSNERLRKDRPVLLGYLRVSKGDDQSPALQRRALAQAGVERVFEETASGG